MTTTPDGPVPDSTGPAYHAWAVLYELPPRPTEPISFAGTEGMGGYFVAYHDRNGRVARLVKELVQWADETPHTATVPVLAEPGSPVYFAAATDPNTGAPTPGEQLDYSATEGDTPFFAGRAGPSGTTADVTLLRRVTQFEQGYAYWPNGRLRVRTHLRSGSPRKEDHYDRRGNRLPDPPAAAEVAAGG